MKGGVALLLLALASCGAPQGSRLSIADPESVHERILDGLTERESDPAAEKSFREALEGIPPLKLKFVDVRYAFSESAPLPEEPRKADYGLYANPLP